MTPDFIFVDSGEHCNFSFGFPEGYTYKHSDFFMAGDEEIRSAWTDRYTPAKKAAIERANGWTVEWVAARVYTNYVTFSCESKIFAFRMAYPIDPAMTEKDINGATIIYPNASSDGWLFAHATKAEHIDRIWLASTAMSSIFDRVMEDRLQQTLASIINNPQTNQQRGVYLKWADMLDFKKDCTSYCVRFEKLLYLGQHKHQAGLNLRDMLLLCIKHVKQEWQKVEDKFDGVAGDVNGIIAALEADHDFETRWEQEARQKREAAARASAEAETETENE